MLVIIGFSPLAHITLYSQDLKENLEGFPFTDMQGMMVSYGLATFFYLSHIPERWWPHTFDVWVGELS